MKRPATMRFTRIVALGAVALLAGACTDEPSGPGTLGAFVEGPVALGAVVLEVRGQGVTGFVGIGDTRTFSAVVSAEEGRHRVVLVDERGGTIEFGIEVTDVAGEVPSVTVLRAATPDNRSAGTSSVEVGFRR